MRRIQQVDAISILRTLLHKNVIRLNRESRSWSIFHSRKRRVAACTPQRIWSAYEMNVEQVLYQKFTTEILSVTKSFGLLSLSFSQTNPAHVLYSWGRRRHTSASSAFGQKSSSVTRRRGFIVCCPRILRRRHRRNFSRLSNLWRRFQPSFEIATKVDGGAPLRISCWPEDFHLINERSSRGIILECIKICTLMFNHVDWYSVYIVGYICIFSGMNSRLRSKDV